MLGTFINLRRPRAEPLLPAIGLILHACALTEDGHRFLTGQLAVLAIEAEGSKEKSRETKGDDAFRRLGWAGGSVVWTKTSPK